LTANRPSSEAVLAPRSVLPSRQPVKPLPLKMDLKPGSPARACGEVAHGDEENGASRSGTPVSIEGTHEHARGEGRTRRHGSCYADGAGRAIRCVPDSALPL
jgi:hypothetical protein